MARQFDNSDYIDVAERIAAIRGEADRQYPDGSFQPWEPFRIVDTPAGSFVSYVAAFYRTPDDPKPGVGSAWEPVPGKTPFTRDSELQNAETSAWGRALVAALAADTKRGIASANEVRNRNYTPHDEPSVLAGWENLAEQDGAHADFQSTVKETSDEVQAAMRDYRKDRKFGWPMPKVQLDEMWDHLASVQASLGDEKRLARAEQVAKEAGLTERAEALRAKAAENQPEDRKVAASGGGS